MVRFLKLRSAEARGNFENPEKYEQFQRRRKAIGSEGAPSLALILCNGS